MDDELMYKEKYLKYKKKYLELLSTQSGGEIKKDDVSGHIDELDKVLDDTEKVLKKVNKDKSSIFKTVKYMKKSLFLANMLNEIGFISKDIFTLKWNGDPYDYQKQVEIVLLNMDRETKTKLCNKLNESIDMIGKIFSSSVGNFIKTIGHNETESLEKMIVTAYNLGTDNAFEIVAMPYNLLPDDAKKTLSNKDDMSKFLDKLIDEFSILFAAEKIDIKFFKEHPGFLLLPLIAIAYPLAGTAALGTLFFLRYKRKLIIKQLEEVRKYTNIYTEVVMKIIPLTFAALIINSHCRKQ